MSDKKIAVLGAGLVGGVMARDLASDGSGRITLVDRSEEVLAAFAETPGLTTRAADLSDRDTLTRVLEDHDLVVGAVPGFMGRALLERVAAVGVDLVDISFAPEEPWDLDEQARRTGATIVVDAGIAPGLSNMLIGRGEAALDTVEKAVCFVGGLPAERQPPWEYKASFSPIDVIEEYVRPARSRENGQEVVRPALSAPEPVEIEGVGTLEAFETDGLRTLLRTSSAATLIEKTMRWPGHRDRIAALRDAGFFSEEAVEMADGTRVVPLDFAARLLLPAWRLEPGDEDFLAMRVDVTGTLAGAPAHRGWELLDRYDRATGYTAMARMTGFTATSVARLLAGGWSRPGIVAPETIGADAEAFGSVLADLAARGVEIRSR